MSGAHRQRGVALLIVLWGCALLAILLGGFAMLARTDALQARYSFAHTRALYAAEAGIARAVYGLRGVAPDRRWIPDGRTYHMQFDGARVVIAITDDGGKVDLNSATPQMLKGLFRAVGIGADKAQTLSDEIMDWRDPDDAARPHGAEVAQYRAAGRDYGPRNGPFRTLSELQQVLDVTPALYRKLAPDLTVWSGRNVPSAAFAPAAVLAALPGMDMQRARELVRRRRAATRAEASSLPTLPDGLSLAGGNAGIVDSIRAEATLPDGTRAIVHTTVRLQGVRTAGPPYAVLDWHQGDSDADTASKDGGASAQPAR